MNSPSIGLAFVLAACISLAVHDLVIGPDIYAPNAKELLIQHAQIILPGAKTVKTPL